jgi:hypothetical protein
MYSQEVNRQNKGLFLFLLDQSYSMEEPIGGSQNRKMDELATVINKWLENLIIRCTGGEGVKDYFDIAAIGYRTDMEANPIIESPLCGPLAGRMMASVAEFGDSDNVGGVVQKMHQFYDEETGEILETPVDTPYWVEAKAEGGTPMCSALYKAYEIVEEWIGEHPRSFPPVLVHITDGENQEDANPIEYADSLRGLETEDGNVLLFNCHLSMTQADTVMFPHSNELLSDELARVLFDMSSKLPEKMLANTREEGFDLEPGARGVVFNADLVALIQFIEMTNAWNRLL